MAVHRICRTRIAGVHTSLSLLLLALQLLTSSASLLAGSAGLGGNRKLGAEVHKEDSFTRRTQRSLVELAGRVGSHGSRAVSTTVNGSHEHSKRLWISHPLKFLEGVGPKQAVLVRLASACLLF